MTSWAGSGCDRLSGVFCSVMVYDSTRRPSWHWSRTGLRFLLTSALLGIPTSLLIAFVAAASTESLTVRQIMDDYGTNLCGWLAVITAFKLLYEASIFVHLFSRRLTSLSERRCSPRVSLAAPRLSDSCAA